MPEDEQRDSGFSPPRPARPGQRVPSGPRPAPTSRDSITLPAASTRTSSSTSIPTSASPRKVKHIASLTSLAAMGFRSESPLDAFSNAEPNFTTSPEQSPGLELPDTPRTPTRPASPAASAFSPKARPKPLKVNTNLVPPASSPSKPVSPSLKHWQQVRSHVVSTPIDEKAALQQIKGKKQGLVSKAAGKFGFRQAADHVIGYDDRRRSMAVVMGDMGDLSLEEREEIARERRRFARDIKACLDTCILEESRRRLARATGSSSGSKSEAHRASSIPLAGPSAYKVPDADFSAFAPLLKEFSNYSNAARAKKPWCRTCPHHGAILAELGTSFLSDIATTEGERQQTLEVYIALVKQWAPENAEEELDRWLFLCRALRIDNRQLRTRGLSLLSGMLHGDPNLPRGHDRPHTAFAFQTLSISLLELLHATKSGRYDTGEHYRTVSDFLLDLAEGEIIDVDQESLEPILGQVGILETAGGGVERELLWMALGKALSIMPGLSTWFLFEQPQLLQSFLPPPILHATPPLILRLRARAVAHHLLSLAAIIETAESRNLQQLWHIASERMQELEQLPADQVLVDALGRCLVTGWQRVGNPFGDQHTIKAVQERFDPTPTFMQYLSSDVWKEGIENAIREIVTSAPVAAAPLIRRLLESPGTRKLGQDVVPVFFSHLGDGVPPPSTVQVLSFLSTSHPQLLYKPLFSLSASTQASTLAKRLETVRSISTAMTPARLWTGADPQMIVIVLMGDSAPKLAKGKGKEGEAVTPNMKLGRFAVLLEFLSALDGVTEPAGSETRLRSFIEVLEVRLGVMLEAEDNAGALTPWYRALMCLLFFKLRSHTKSLKRGLSPTSQTTASDQASDQAAQIALGSAYQALSKIGEKDAPNDAGRSRAPSMLSPPLTKTSRHDSVGSVNLDDIAGSELFALSVEVQGAALLVLISACLSREDWADLVLPLWRHIGESKVQDIKAITFLLMKCGQYAPDRSKDAITSDLRSSNALLRSLALRKLAKLYGYRFQVLAQLILSNRRGPIFSWPPKNMEFVTTEIGSPTWSAPQEVQDAALQKFGNNLPLELRQRLMQLGWSDDANMTDDVDIEKMPVSQLPSTQWHEKNEDTSRPKLVRRGSSESEASSIAAKRRKAVYAPVLTIAVHEQSSLLSHEVDGIVDVLSNELVRMLQRNDPGHLLRPFTDRALGDFPRALARLNAVAVSTTPGFAYVSFNALVGYLKHVVRHSQHPDHAPALATIAILTPHVSEISLRDVRKNKAESILLPASIHEEHGGFNLHRPWQDDSIGVQSAQLLFLAECLKVNPREVYLIKKMLSNLPIQPSIPNIYFSRAWLLLVTALFSTLNRNYNDRAELRHFLVQAATILRLHGATDLFITAHAIRVFMLCAARFRRLFATAGFASVMRSVYEVYASGDPAVQDCVEYACRSFYRIHGDAFVFQTCVAIAEGDFDAVAAYNLLSSLSVPNSPSTGIASGIRGLNDKEEIDALVRMLSGPEIALNEIGTDRAERQAAKMSALDLEAVPFPKDNIVKLFVTAIAANPSARRSGRFLQLFGGMITCITDTPSRDLLREGVEALGVLIARARAADEAAIAAFHSGSDQETSDWLGARREYIRLVDSYASAGGTLGASATKVILEIVLDLLRKDPGNVGPAASGILRGLAKTHLASSRATTFLRDIAPLFGQFVSVIDFSGVLDSISEYITKNAYSVHPDMADIIIGSYVEPSVRLLASEESGAFIQLREAIVKLVCAAVFIPGDAFSAIERHPPTASLLASLIMPLVLILASPHQIDQSECMGLWIRILNYVSRPPSRARKTAMSRAALAARAVLTLQVIKIIMLRAPEAISNVKGLWTYIATHLLATVSAGNGSFAEPGAIQPPPRVVDWMMWSIFELLALHANPLMITFRHHIQIHLQTIQQAAARSRPSTPGSKPRATLSPMMPGRARISSRIPSVALHGRSPSSSPEVSGHSRVPSAGRLTPEASGHARIPSNHLSPHLGHSRNFSGSLSVPGGRPSFADLSARRASRPVFDALPSSPSNHASNAMRFRFPSSAPIRNLPTSEKGGGGAIIHLLGAPAQVLSATSTAFPTFAPRSSVAGEALRDLRIRNDALWKGAKRAVRVCMVVFGYSWDEDPDEDESPVRSWTTHDALNVVAEQTRLFVEYEFQEVFTRSGEMRAEPSVEEKGPHLGYSLDQMIPRASGEFDEKGSEGYNPFADHDESYDTTNPFEVPLLAITTP